jgi:glycine C-acetyltransferase
MKTEFKIEGTNEVISFLVTSEGDIDATKYSLLDVLTNSNLDNLDLNNRLIVFNSWLNDMNKRGLSYHRRIAISSCNTTRIMHDPIMDKNSSMINFASNDYLNLSQHPDVISAAIRAIEEFGAGPGSPSNFAGHSIVKENLENEIAQTFGYEKSLVFSSGYSTNVGVLRALLRSNDVAIVDMLAHASIMDGVEGKNHMLFKHNDMQSLENLLSRANKQYANKIVVVDAVYSMDGDIANLPEISALCKKYNALLMVDEAHSVGVIGKNGLGILDHFNMPPESIDILMGTLSKGIGATGGYITGSERLINYCILGCRSYLFTTASCIASNAAALEAIKILKREPERVVKLRKNIDYFLLKLKESGYNTGNTNSSIIPIILADHNKVLAVTRNMAKYGVLTNGIPYPIVPRRKTRIRMTITANMTIEQLNKGVEALGNAINDYENGVRTPSHFQDDNGIIVIS